MFSNHGAAGGFYAYNTFFLRVRFDNREITKWFPSRYYTFTFTPSGLSRGISSREFLFAFFPRIRNRNFRVSSGIGSFARDTDPIVIMS